MPPVEFGHARRGKTAILPLSKGSHERVHLEAEAVVLLLRDVEAGESVWVGSEILSFEIGQTPDRERRRRVRSLLSLVQEWVSLEASQKERANVLVQLGFGVVDALHLACAESGKADVFLTTDDRLVRLGARFAGQLNVRVDNPLSWTSRELDK